jgi:predicted metal-dependent hydrolase
MKRLVQLVLDLFEPAAASPTPSAEAPKAAGEPHFAHPRANRTIMLSNTPVAYAMVRARRRTIGMLVGPDGLEVRAPRWVGMAEIESTLREKSDWIVRKLEEMRQQQAQQAQAQIAWAEGATFPYLGQAVRIRLGPSAWSEGAGAVLEPGEPLQGKEACLHIGLPMTATPEQIRDATQAWLMRQARRVFQERLNHFAPQLGVTWTRLSLSSASTRWGSASANGSIRLNWRLIHHRLDVLDYVVVHELSHLQVMDHSPRFWDTVKTVLPDYAQRRATLKTETLPPWP